LLYLFLWTSFSYMPFSADELVIMKRSIDIWIPFFFQSAQLQFRGQKIWLAAMEELMSKGMQKANQVSHFSLYCFSVFWYASMPIIKWYQALLSGCSAGGLASIIHCDEFRSLFPESSKVKCLSDAGFFLDA